MFDDVSNALPHVESGRSSPAVTAPFAAQARSDGRSRRRHAPALLVDLAWPSLSEGHAEPAVVIANGRVKDALEPILRLKTLESCVGLRPVEGKQWLECSAARQLGRYRKVAHLAANIKNRFDSRRSVGDDLNGQDAACPRQDFMAEKFMTITTQCRRRGPISATRGSWRLPTATDRPPAQTDGPPEGLVGVRWLAAQAARQQWEHYRHAGVRLERGLAGALQS